MNRGLVCSPALTKESRFIGEEDSSLVSCPHFSPWGWGRAQERSREACIYPAEECFQTVLGLIFSYLTSSHSLSTPGPSWPSRAPWIRWGPWPSWHIPHAPSELSSGLWNGLMRRAGALCCITENQKVRKAEVSLKTVNPKTLIFWMAGLGPH